MRWIAALLSAVALACGGARTMVLDLEHRAVVREEELPAGVSRVIYAVTLSDERGDDPHFLCNVGGDVLSERPVPELVREAVEAELSVRDMRVVSDPDEADVVLHLELHDFLCSGAVRSRSLGINGKIQAEVSLRLMPGQREVYWTTLTEEAFRVPAASHREKPEVLVLKALEDVLDEFAQHVATHPDLMIEIQRLQASGELPE